MTAAAAQGRGPEQIDGARRGAGAAVEWQYRGADGSDAGVLQGRSVRCDLVLDGGGVREIAVTADARGKGQLDGRMEMTGAVS